LPVTVRSGLLSAPTLESASVFGGQYGGQYTVPLKGAQISISDGKREQFRGMTTEDPMEIKLERGSYVIRPSYFGYYMVTDKMVKKDSYDIAVEPSTNYLSVILILIPQE